MPRLLVSADRGSGSSSRAEQDILPDAREPAFRRAASSTPDTLRSAAGQESSARSSSAGEATETLFCEHVLQQIRCQHPELTQTEVLLAGFLLQRMQKELPPRGNPPALQAEVDEAKQTEWCTMLSNPATRVWKGADADRFVGSRFVITRKEDEDGVRIKARWCLQGHLDPAVMSKVTAGACHLRPCPSQIWASEGWQMCLGDMKGAFLEGPLYARHPQGSIPGVDPDDVIEVIGNVYGLNDAPFWWWDTFDSEARVAGFVGSQLDNCVYFFRCPNTGELSGVLACGFRWVLQRSVLSGSQNHRDKIPARGVCRTPPTRVPHSSQSTAEGRRS